MALTGRPISVSERSERSSEHLLLYGWKMLIRKDYGGSKNKSSDLLEELYSYGISTHIRLMASPRKEDMWKKINRSTPISFEVVLAELKDYWKECCEDRISRVQNGIKDRLSHTKSEFIQRINAVDKFNGRPATGDEKFKNWDCLFAGQVDFMSHLDAFVHELKEVWDGKRSVELACGRLADVLFDVEDQTRSMVKHRVGVLTDEITPILYEFDRIRAAV